MARRENQDRRYNAIGKKIFVPGYGDVVYNGPRENAPAQMRKGARRLQILAEMRGYDPKR